jgi:putative methyltransferase (TIGR04325 family)
MRRARFALRWALKAVTPPIVLLGLRELLRALGLRKAPLQAPPPEADPPEWEYVPEGWSRPVRGWNAEGVLETYRAKWPAFFRALEGSGPLAVNHEAAIEDIERRDDLEAHNLVVSFAYVLALAARARGRISLLDWGGGIGHYYLIARAVLPDVQIDYHCRDLPILAAEGRGLIPEATFYEDDSCLERRYDLVVASSSLQYAERWRETLAGLAGAAERYLYVTRVPVARSGPSFVVLQRADRHGYGTEYLGWVLSRAELLEAASDAGLRLVREFLLGGRFDAAGAPEGPTGHRGFLFAPTYTDSRP